MLDVSQIVKRYFDIRITVEETNGKTKIIELQIEPPTLKQLSKLTEVAAVSKSTPEKMKDAMNDLCLAVKNILSKNKTGYKVPSSYVESLDLDQLNAIFTAYMEWVNAERKVKN